MSAPNGIQDVVRLLNGAGLDLPAVGFAWARLLPAITIVPAFGLKALPLPARAMLGLALALSIFPAMGMVSANRIGPWPVLLLEQILRGLPIAIAAAVPLWAATMTGGVVDTLRGAQGEGSSPVVEGRASSMSILFSMLASAIFLTSGGASRIVSALAFEAVEMHPVAAVARDLAGGITVAVSIGAPVLVASIVLEIGTALIARAASPAQVHLLLAPLRSLAVLAVVALILERIASVIVASLH